MINSARIKRAIRASRSWSWWVVALAVVPSTARAAEYVPVPEKVLEKKAPDGWAGKLSLGANFSLGTNTDVVGQQNGASLTIGGTASSGLDFRRAQHEWRNTLDFKESFARTPSIPKMVKAADQLMIETIYLFRPLRFPWFGPFARGLLDTPILEGNDMRAEPVSYLLPDGTTRLADQLKLTQAFTPMTLKQSLGAFAKPVDKPAVSVEFRLGFGAMQIFAADQLAIADDDQTPEVEVLALRDMIQAGAEATAGVVGSLQANKVTYKAGVEVLVPFINNQLDADDRSAFELTNVDFLVKLSFKLVSWASLDYEFRAIRKPQLLDKFQLQNNLLLTFSYSLVRPEPPKEEQK